MRLTPEQAQLAADNVGLALDIAQKAKIANNNWADDIESALLEALARAAARWHPNGGASFATYASRRLRFAVLDELRILYGGRTKARLLPDSLDRVVEAAGNHSALGAEDVYPVDDADFLDWALAELSERQRTLATRVWVNGELGHALAAEAGLTPAAISHRLKHIRLVVRGRLEASQEQAMSA